MPILQLDPDKPLGRKMQRLQTLFYLFLGAPLVIFLVAYLQAEQPGYQAKVDSNLLMNVGLWLVVGLITFYAWRTYSQQLKRADGTQGLNEKFALYQRLGLRAYILLLLAMLLSTAGLWLSGAVFYGALFSIVLITMAALRPTAEQFIERLHLSPEEQAQLLRQE